MEENCLTSICELQCEVVNYAEEHKDSLSLDEMGQIADIIKDLAEAMYYDKKACNMTVKQHLQNELSEMTQLEKLSLKAELMSILNEVK